MLGASPLASVSIASWASFSHISWAPGDESGILPEELAPAYRWDTSQGMAPVNMKGYIDRINREYNRTNRLALDDQAATEFIMALVHSEILNGAL